MGNGWVGWDPWREGRRECVEGGGRTSSRRLDGVGPHHEHEDGRGSQRTGAEVGEAGAVVY